MYLFGKEKDLILKLTNLVLLLWLIVSIVIVYMNMVDILMPKPLMNYDDYKRTNCLYDVTQDEDTCQSQYKSYKSYNDNEIYNTKRVVFTSIGSVIIVSGALYALNRKKKKEAK